MLPLMEHEFVRRRRWLTSDDFMDVVSLVNSLPGVIAANSALYIGWKVAGILGAAAALLGAVTPSVLIILALAQAVAWVRVFPLTASAFAAVRAAVATLIVLMLIRQARKLDAGVRELVVAGAALLAVRVAGINAIFVILAAAVVGVLVFREGDS